MPNPSDEPPASFKATNEDLKDMDALCILKIKIKMLNPSHEPPASFKAPYEDLKDMDILCTFKIKVESQNLDYDCIRDYLPYPNHDQDYKPQSSPEKDILTHVLDLLFVHSCLHIT